ncbi:glucosyltransferase [Bacteroidia bacterium]|nr:glucosyltransferase [Bacteroidia bacterium]
MNRIEKQIIPIAFCVDDNYIPFMATAIQSIMENADPDNDYHIYIIHEKISKKHIELLKKQMKKHLQFSIFFINVAHYKELLIKNRRFGVAIYFKLMIPFILAEYEKILFLDGDIVVLSDITKLFNYNLENYLLGAVHNSTIANQRIGMKNPHNYFNSGVMLFNTKAFVQMINQNQLIEMATSTKYNLPDQDILNIVCEDKVCFLHKQWNSIENGKVGIMHFIWDKPWQQLLVTQRTKYFWYYARKTPFINEIYFKFIQLAPMRTLKNIIRKIQAKL